MEEKVRRFLTCPPVRELEDTWARVPHCIQPLSLCLADSGAPGRGWKSTSWKMPRRTKPGAQGAPALRTFPKLGNFTKSILGTWVISL